MIKLLCMWFLGVYTFDTTVKGYTSVTKEHTFSEMKEYMYHCQDREDKLREQCDLQMYIIPPSQSLVSNLIERCYTNSNYYLAHRMDADNYEHFMELSYEKDRLGSVIVLDETHYTLIRYGIKSPRTHSYANQMNEVYPQNPVWTITIGERTVTITDIK